MKLSCLAEQLAKCKTRLNQVKQLCQCDDELRARLLYKLIQGMKFSVLVMTQDCLGFNLQRKHLDIL